jgi:hypothetical protein
VSNLLANAAKAEIVVRGRFVDNMAEGGLGPADPDGPLSLSLKGTLLASHGLGKASKTHVVRDAISLNTLLTKKASEATTQDPNTMQRLVVAKGMDEISYVT